MRNTTTTPRDQMVRTAGWTGVAFAVTFVAGFLLVAQVPGYDDPDAAWVAMVDDSGDRIRTVSGSLLLSAAALLLMAFTSTLGRHLERETRSPLGSILQGAGVIAAASLALASVIGGSMSFAVTFAPDFPTPNADVLRVLDQLGVGVLLLGTGWAAAVVVACASRLAAPPEALPEWLTTAGLVIAAALAVSFLFLPILLLPVWAFTTGIVLLRDAGTPAT